MTSPCPTPLSEFLYALRAETKNGEAQLHLDCAKTHQRRRRSSIEQRKADLRWGNSHSALVAAEDSSSRACSPTRERTPQHARRRSCQGLTTPKRQTSIQDEDSLPLSQFAELISQASSDCEAGRLDRVEPRSENPHRLVYKARAA